MLELSSHLKSVYQGSNAFLRGLKWLGNHPLHLFILFIPVLLGLGGFILSFKLAWDWALGFLPMYLTAHDDFFAAFLYYGALAVLLTFAVLVGGLFFMLLLNCISFPFYEFVSLAVEKELTGKEPPPMTLKHTLALLYEEVKKIALILIISSIILLIPGVNVISPLASAFFIGWDLYDLPFARQGYGLRQRRKILMRNGWSVLGLGLWFLIPGVAFLLMPLAVPGATMLALESRESKAP